MLKLRLPNNCHNERRYVIGVILGEFLGIEFEIDWVDSLPHIEIIDSNNPSVTLQVDDTFLAWASTNWLIVNEKFPLAGSASSLPMANFDSVVDEIPVIFGRQDSAGSWISSKCSITRLHVDVFGAAFFMLSRYEELVRRQRDSHDRFPSLASVAGQNAFLDRPIIDEYVEILWSVIHRLWPYLTRCERKFSITLTHDVDLPLKYGFSPFLRTFAAVVRDAFTLGYRTAIHRYVQWQKVRAGDYTLDPFNTFDWIMDLAERNGINSEFYFLAGQDHYYDTLYDISDPFILGLLTKIHNRGHKVGLHSSYTTYQDTEKTAMEFQRLRKLAASLDISQALWGGRQHFLRWANPQTMRNYEEAGLQFDSSLGYADRNGFRCGVCREYPAYDLLERKQLRLRLRPLIMMDSILATHMALGWGDKAREHIASLKKSCLRVRGDFVLLWHNSNLISEDQRETLRCAIEN
jgi:hypothetical protein